MASSLRLLLGYDPKELKSRAETRQKSAEGKVTRLSLTSTINVPMASKRPPYQVSMGKVKRLPPISEEASPRNSPRPTLAHVTLRRLPKNRNAFKPTTSKPVIPVKTQPKQKEFSDFSPPQTPRKRIEPAPSPADVKHTLVDGLVADYLHYARYGHVIPMYEGTGVTTCPCCVDRNRQNVRTLLGFPNDIKDPPRKKPLPQKYDKDSNIEPTGRSVHRSDTVIFPNSMYAKEKQGQKIEPSESEKKLHAIAQESQKRTWMSYQPMRHATNYLNPEFNRPVVVNNYLQERPSKEYNYIAGQVVEADSDYTHAMNKLERLAFGGSS